MNGYPYESAVFQLDHDLDDFIILDQISCVPNVHVANIKGIEQESFNYE